MKIVNIASGLSLMFPSIRYWNVDLWKPLFSKLLNIKSNESDVPLLQSLRSSFEDYMCRNPQLINKLKHLLLKQKASLCSAQHMFCLQINKLLFIPCLQLLLCCVSSVHHYWEWGQPHSKSSNVVLSKTILYVKQLKFACLRLCDQ